MSQHLFIPLPWLAVVIWQAGVCLWVRIGKGKCSQKSCLVNLGSCLKSYEKMHVNNFLLELPTWTFPDVDKRHGHVPIYRLPVTHTLTCSYFYTWTPVCFVYRPHCRMLGRIENATALKLLWGEVWISLALLLLIFWQKYEHYDVASWMNKKQQAKWIRVNWGHYRGFIEIVTSKSLTSQTNLQGLVTESDQYKTCGYDPVTPYCVEY